MKRFWVALAASLIVAISAYTIWYYTSAAAAGGGPVAIFTDFSGGIDVNTTGNITVQKYTVTVNSTINNCLVVVGESHWESPSPTVTGVTFNGNAMTIAGNVTPGPFRSSAAYYAAGNLTAGTYTIEITYSSELNEANSGVIFFSGVNQSSPVGSVVTTSGSGTSASTGEMSSDTNGMFVAIVGTHADITSNGGETSRYVTDASGTVSRGYSAAGAASVTMSWTLDSQSWSLIAFAINP
jgi:hypothetical protein